MRQDVGQEVASLVWPVGPVVAAGSSGLKMLFVREPPMAQFVEAGLFDHETLGGGIGIQEASIKGAKNFLYEQGRRTECELSFFMAGE